MHALRSFFVLSEPLPVESLAVVRKQCDKAEIKARSEIVRNLDMKLVIAVYELLERKQCSVLEVWKKLLAIYKKDTIQSKLNLCQRLGIMVYKNREDIRKHLGDLKITLLERALLGYPLADKNCTNTLLNTLFESLMAITELVDATNREYYDFVTHV